MLSIWRRRAAVKTPAKGEIMPLPLDRLKGSIPPLITPFKNGEVDYDTYARVVERQIAEGSHGILVNGTTAEPATLTIEERNRLVDLAVKLAKGRVPVVAATGSQSLRRHPGAHRARGESRRRRALDPHALFHAAAAARDDSILSGGDEGHRRCRG